MIKYSLIIVLLLQSCTIKIDKPFNEQAINNTLNSWHKAASDADFDTYFSLMAEDAHFIGTDATENWTKTAFMQFAKPFFDKGKAWDFTVLDRNIYHNNKTVWFDERLDTWMGICRGSGVLQKKADTWKIKHYVLSLTIPNTTVNQVKKINDSITKKLLLQLKNN